MRTRGRFRWAPWAATVLAGAALTTAQACSTSTSDAPAACTPGGAACASGETCWPTQSTGDYRCVAALAAAGFGTACENTLGVATCGAGLTCDEPSAGQGTCTSYCSTTVGCPAGHGCYQLASGDAVLTICRATADGGTVLGVNLIDGGNGGTAPGVPDDGGIVSDPSFDANFEAGELPQ